MKRQIIAALVVASCGPSQPLKHPTGELAASPAQPAQPPSPSPSQAMQLELTALVVRGELHALDADGWRPLVAGQSLAGVTELRATRRAAMVSLGHGDAAGRLWLRANTRVRIGQDAAGIHLAVLDGRVRIRRGAAALPVTVGDKAIDGDSLIDAASVLPTAVFPELAAWSLALERDDAGAGVGRMEATGASGAPEALELRKVDVRVRIEGDLAVTEVEHVFHNPADGRPREGTFRFPVPDGAMLTGLAMEIDGKLVEGEIVERDRARQIYDEVVDSMQDPALLEWEAGNWFKLRVFPIPANGDKRVVIRYTAPLSRSGHGHEYAYDLAIANASAGGTAPGAIFPTGEDPRPAGKAVGVPTPLARTSPIGELSVSVDGKQVAHETAATGLEIAVPVAGAPMVMREIRKDATYTAVRVAPDASLLAAPAPAAPRTGLDVAIVFDTSRSSLEGRKLADQLLETTLAELGPADRFVVLASDVAVTPSAAGLAPVTAEAIGKARSFLAAIEPDGASDVGAALTAAAALHPGEVIYIGDGIPTWGEQKPAALGALADQIGAPIHAALIGKGATTSLWGDLTGRTGGRAIVVRRADDAARFALVASHAREIPRMVASRVVVGGDAQVFPQQATTLYLGDELVALIKTAPGQSPASLTLTGLAGGKPVSQPIALAAAVDEPGVAQRFGADLIAGLEASDADREIIVAASRDYGVLSKYTSLLVLENDEAYRKYNIERKQQQQLAQAAPQVTGGDLDTLGARRANLSPDEIQPGDPEVKVPAPADAREVLVSFPFGETKRAAWDPDLDAWMVRFLIDKDTPDGQYLARVTVTHADGHVQLMSLPYTVDTHAPTVQLTATRVAGGYRIAAKQTDGGSRRKDADKIEVVLPDGTILALTQSAWGRFEGVWQTPALDHAVTLRVVVHDRALNQAAFDLVVGAAP